MVTRDNSAYWKKRRAKSEEAKAHTKFMAENYSDEIDECIKNSKIYATDKPEMSCEANGTIPKMYVIDMDSVSAVLKACEAFDKKKIGVLNFASFKNPGGKFIEGSIAQEEALCHESFLYNVLSSKEFASYYESNLKILNKGLYANKAIFSPDVIFKRNDKVCKACVLTCAAPNRFVAINNQGLTEDDNHNALFSRCKFVLDVMDNNGVDIPVLGAFGCGVFAQDASVVAEIFKKLLSTGQYHFNRVLFAIIGGDDNYDKFNNVINFKEV